MDTLQSRKRQTSLDSFCQIQFTRRFDKVSTDLYLNDSVLTIHKSTLETHQGIIVYLGSRVCICKRGNKSCVYVDPSEVYFSSNGRNNETMIESFMNNYSKIM